MDYINYMLLIIVVFTGLRSLHSYSVTVSLKQLQLQKQLEVQQNLKCLYESYPDAVLAAKDNPGIGTRLLLQPISYYKDMDQAREYMIKLVEFSKNGENVMTMDRILYLSEKYQRIIGPDFLGCDVLGVAFWKLGWKIVDDRNTQKDLKDFIDEEQLQNDFYYN